MAVPKFQEFLLPILKLAEDGAEHTTQQAHDEVVRAFQVSPTDQRELLSSGTQTRLRNRISWAIIHLTRAGLVDKPARGRFIISDRGRQVLQGRPSQIDLTYLHQFPEFRKFTSKRDSPKTAEAIAPNLAHAQGEETPEERIESAHDELRAAIVEEILRRVNVGSPKAFELLVVRVLDAMGYGDGRPGSAIATGKSGDDGIDGVIQEDRLGLDVIYVQAKRHEHPVGPGDIDKFVGSLTRKKAHKGVFITSGTFTEGARRAAKERKVRLVDGKELAGLMIDHNVGVAVAAKYEIKRIDSDFFDELDG